MRTEVLKDITTNEPVWKEITRKGQKLRAQAVNDIFRVQNELISNENREIAETRNQHAEKILNFITHDPDRWKKEYPEGITNIPPVWGGELPDPANKEAIREYKTWLEFLKMLMPDEIHHSKDWVKITEEVVMIASAPAEVQVNNQYTIIGKGFGEVSGILQVIGTPPDNNKIFSLTILSWTDISIQFKVPETVSGIPLNWKAVIRVKTKRGSINYRPVIVQPLSHICWSVDTYANSGIDLELHSEKRDFSSAVLPDSYAQFAFPNVGSGVIRGCVRIQSWDELVHTPIGTDAPVRVVINNNPVVVNNRLKVNCTLQDDFIWNFTAQAEFYIVTPKDAKLPAGWFSHK